MRKTWTAILLGLALGFLLMGALIRGCEPGADGELAAIPESTLVTKLPQSRIGATRPLAAFAPQTDLRSTLGAAPSSSSAPLPPASAQTDRSRNTVEEERKPLDDRASSSIISARAASLARSGTNSNRLAAQRLGRGFSARDSINDAELRDELARRASLTNQNPSGLATLDARALAQQRLDADTAARLQRQESARDADGSDPADTGDAGAEDNAPPRNNSSESDILQMLSDQILAGATQRSEILALILDSGILGPGVIITNPQPAPAPADPADPTDPPTVPDSDTNDPPPGDSGDGASPPPPPPAPVEATAIARWIPVESDTACASTRDTRTNDLFIGLSVPMGVQIITSAPPLSLDIVGGSFVQDSRNGNRPPDDATLLASPCAAFDSYLTLGGGRDFFFAGPEPPADDWGASLDFVLVTPITTPFGVIGERDPGRFGDDRFYVPIGRFTATGNPEFVGGTLVVNAFNIATFSSETFMVPVPHEPSLWFVEGAAAPDIRLTSFGFDQTTTLAGQLRALTVTIDQPAPPGGVEIVLGSSSPLLSIPESIVIQEGRTSGGLLIPTPDVPGFINITVSARLGQTTVFASLSIEPAPTDIILSELTITPAVVRAGEIATGLVTLARVAPPGGRVVELSIDDPTIATIPASVHVPEGETVATFEIRAATIIDRRNARIWASVGEQIRTASFMVTPRSDLNSDGVIDGADLLFVLNDFGSMTGGLADLNNDGEIDGLDLLIILNAFNTTPAPTEPDPFSGDVIARWVPVAVTAPCTSLDGYRSNDLYLGFTGQPQPNALVLTSQAPNQIRIANGSFFQVPSPFGSNSPPNPAGVQFEPCLTFDSHITIAEGAPNFVVLPNPDDWGAALDALWFSLDTPRMFIERSVAKFGDDRFYIRIGRFTANEGARVDGSILVDFILAGSDQLRQEVLPIVNCPVCWRSFDLTGDGAVNAGDIERLMSRMGTDDPDADLDGDGIVTASDLAILVERVSAGDTD